MKPVGTTREKEYSIFLPECKDLVELLHGVTGYQFSEQISVLMPIHHFGSSPQSWPIVWLSSGSCTITSIGFYLVQLKQLTKKEVTLTSKLSMELTSVSTGGNYLCLVTSPWIQINFANFASAAKTIPQTNNPMVIWHKQTLYFSTMGRIPCTHHAEWGFCRPKWKKVHIQSNFHNKGSWTVSLKVLTENIINLKTSINLSSCLVFD